MSGQDPSMTRIHHCSLWGMPIPSTIADFEMFPHPYVSSQHDACSSTNSFCLSRFGLQKHVGTIVALHLSEWYELWLYLWPVSSNVGLKAMHVYLIEATVQYSHDHVSPGSQLLRHKQRSPKNINEEDSMLLIGLSLLNQPTNTDQMRKLYTGKGWKGMERMGKGSSEALKNVWSSMESSWRGLHSCRFQDRSSGWGAFGIHQGDIESQLDPWRLQS